MNARDAATLRRVLLGLLLLCPMLVVCFNPEVITVDVGEMIEEGDSGSGDAAAEVTLGPFEEAETLPPNDSGEEETVLATNFAASLGQVVVSRDGFEPGQATSRLNVYVRNGPAPVVVHGASRAWMEVTGNPTGGAFDFTARVQETMFGSDGLPAGAYFDAQGHARAMCFDTRTPGQPVRFALPVGETSRFTLPLAPPLSVTAAAHCEFELETAGAAKLVPGALHTIVLTLTQISSSKPEALDDLPPTVSPIEAEFVPVEFTTYYSVEASDPEGGELSYEWSGFNCGDNGPLPFATDDRFWFWYHKNPPCTHPSSAHEDATIEVIVSDGANEVSCTYSGAETGVGQPESCERLAEPVDLP